MGAAIFGEPSKVSSEGAVVVHLSDVRRPRAALNRWHQARARIAEARQRFDASHSAVELYGFKQRQALDLLEDLGWQHERFYGLHHSGADWSALGEEVLDAMECASSLLELEPGSVAGENLLLSLVRRVPALNRALEQLEHARAR